MASKITVKAPSSTANLGPGFDTFGLAIDAFYDEITLTKTKNGITIITDDNIPTNPENNTAGLVVKNMKKESINPYKIAAIGGTLLILLQIFRIFASRLQLVDLMYPGTLATVTMSFASLIISVMLYYGYIYFGKQNNNILMVISSILVIFSLVVSSSFTLLTFLFQKFTALKSFLVLDGDRQEQKMYLYQMYLSILKTLGKRR